MITIFNRREVCVTRRADERARVCGLLAAAGIERVTKTNSMRNPGRSHGVPFISPDSAYEYRVYVAAGDYPRAREALGL